MSSRLDAYLKRIGFEGVPAEGVPAEGVPAVNQSTLFALQRQHLLRVPYENLDVQLQRPLDLNVEAAFDKIVNRRRGGWCYEMNGVLGWALEEIGFDVTYLGAGVSRSKRGDSALGNHLLLLVNLEGNRWVTDVGFGDGFIEPIRLAPNQFEQRGFAMGLSRTEDGYWRYHNHKYGGAPDFDFLAESADRSLLAEQCQWLQTHPDSTFVQVFVVQQFNALGYDIQVGPIAKTIGPNGVEQVVLDSAAQFEDRLGEVFGIQDPELKGLWPKVWESYEQYRSKMDN